MATRKPLKRKPRALKNNPDCKRCSLHRGSGTICCQSVGPENADIFLVGEALGATEGDQGRPFIGDSGYKLNYLLKRAKLRRKSCRIGNAVRCRPPGNRAPRAIEIQKCWPYLLADILKTKPKVIVALGGVATAALLGNDFKVGKWRGFPQKRTFTSETKSDKKFPHTCWVVPTYHPSACLHNWTLDDVVEFDLRTAIDYAQGDESLKWPDTKVNVVRTLRQVRQLFDTLGRVDRFVLDLETTGLDPHTTKILCIGFCYKAGEAHILPLRQQGGKRFWKLAEETKIVGWLTDLLREANLMGQNIKFDIQHLRKLTGLIEYKIVFDTLLAHHCCDENKRHNLTFLCQWFLRWQKYDALMSDFQSRGDDDTERVTYADAPDSVLHTYCGFDVDGTFQLRAPLAKMLREEKTRRVFRTELGLIVPIADMEYRGITVHPARLRELSVMYRQKIVDGLARLDKIARRLFHENEYIEICRGVVFNPNSPPQLRRLLTIATKDKLKKKTPTGLISTDKYVLSALSLQKGSAGTIAKIVRDLRVWGPKYVSQFLDGKDGRSGLVSWIGTKNRIHTNYNLGLTRTGRLSNDDPPLQTIPRGGGLRTMFIPDSSQHCLIQCDYEKLELCIMSWLANDHVMARELIERQDLHTRMALTVQLGRDPTDAEFKELASTVTKDKRAIAKGVNFGVPYGRSDFSIVEANPDAFPLDWDGKRRQETVANWMAQYFEKYWGVRAYLENEIATAHKRGYLRTWEFGRKRRLSGVDWFFSDFGLKTSHRDNDLGHLDREARNFRIQSIASDTLSAATKRVWDGMQTRQGKLPGFRMVMTVHDALIFTVYRKYMLEACERIKQWMEVVLPKDKQHEYEMPLRIECLPQEFWGQEYLEKEEQQDLFRWYKTRGVGPGATIDLAAQRLLPPRFTRKMKRVELWQ